MFSINRRYPLLKKLIIVVFTIPLMFAGGSLLSGEIQNLVIGKVGDFEIPQAEFSYHYRNAVENYRRNTGTDELTQDISQLIIEDVKKNLLDSYLLKASIERKGIYAPDTVVAKHIRSDPQLQEDGEFSLSLYRQYISNPKHYNEQIRENANNLILLNAINSIPVPEINEKLAAFRRQERVVDSGYIYPADYPDKKIDITEQQIDSYLRANVEDYRIEEQASFEYFIFSTDDLTDQVSITDEDITDAYDNYVTNINDSERRKISHIYTESKDKIDDIFQQLQQGGDFTELAKTQSEDTGSAVTNGEIGILARGDFPDAFDTVAFSAPQNVVQPPIEVNDGYSIIRVDEIIAKDISPLEDIKDIITQQAKQQVATEKLDETINLLIDMAPTEFGSLHNMAQLVKQPVKKAVAYKNDLSKNTYPFNNESAIIDAFEPVVIQEQENSQPIFIDDNTYMVVRLIKHQPEQLQSIDIVTSKITEKLLAYQLAATLYADINISKENKTGAVIQDQSSIDTHKLLRKIEWKTTHTIVLAQESFEAYENDESFTLPTDVIDEIYGAPIASELPAFVFIPDDKGLRVIRINSIKNNTPLTEDFNIVEELLLESGSRLSSSGYIDAISAEHNFQFYSTPDVSAISGQPTSTPPSQ